MLTKVRLERMNSGHTVLEASKALGVPDSLLSGLERGKMACSLWLRPKIASFLGVPDDNLFDRHGFPLFINE